MKQTTKKKTARKGSAKKSKPTARAEQIINSTKYSAASRLIIQTALDNNLSNLDLLCETVENGDGIAERVDEMTTQKQASIPQVPDEDFKRSQGLAFTYEQAERYGKQLGMILSGDDNDISDVILAFRALCYSDERENILRALEWGLMPLSPSVSNALDKIVADCSRAWDRFVPPTKKG
jgi:hypothetical protein